MTPKPATHVKGPFRRTPLAIVTLLAATAAGVSFAGCSSPPIQGKLDGTLQAVGGPGETGPRALSGQVTFHGSTGHIATLGLTASGRFSANLPVGTYTVTGRSPQFEGGAGACQASGPVTVTTGATARVDVNCQET